MGTFFGHQVILTTDDAKSFTGANLRFPRDGVTVVVISNDDQNDVEDAAVRAAAMVFGKTLAAPTPPSPPKVDPAKAVPARSMAGTR